MGGGALPHGSGSGRIRGRAWVLILDLSPSSISGNQTAIPGGGRYYYRPISCPFSCTEQVNNLTQVTWPGRREVG